MPPSHHPQIRTGADHRLSDQTTASLWVGSGAGASAGAEQPLPVAPRAARPHRLEPDGDELRELHRAVVAGLRSDPRRLSPLLWQDHYGALLTSRLTRSEEYYLLRSDWRTLRRHVGQLGRDLDAASGPHLVEIGSGEGILAEILVGGLHPTRLTALDSSDALLEATGRRIASHRIPLRSLRVPSPLEIPADCTGPGMVVHIPSTTLCALPRNQVRQLMLRLGRLVAPDGAMLLGFDRTREPAIAIRAYRDQRGCHREIAAHAITRLHSLFGWTIAPSDFEPAIDYNPTLHRVDLGLRARRAIVIGLHDTTIAIPRGSHVFTGHHHLYRATDICRMAGDARLRIDRIYDDDQRRCCLAVMRPREHCGPESDLLAA